MPYALVRLTVEDYAKWKPVFDEVGSLRQSSGSKGGYVFRDADNADEVVILLEWDALDRARQFYQSDELRQAMQRAGVSGRPDIAFLEEADRPSA